MATKNKRSVIALLGIVLCALLALQIGLNFSSSNTASFREALEAKLAARSDIDERRKSVLRIQLSVRDWMSKHGNIPPQRIEELIPEYFDRIPTDPITGKPFLYVATEGTFSVGEAISASSSESKIAAGSTDLSNTPSGRSSAEQETQNTQVAANRIDEEYIYNPEGKRDPFLAFDFSPTKSLDGRTELEQFEIGQLRLTATLEGLGEPKAIVESSTGKGFTVTIGTKIGPNNGEVLKIEKDRLVIVESETDFTGETKMNTIEMLLRIPGQSASGGKAPSRAKNNGTSRKASFR
ncbi:MAG: pilus assembly protein PilP [Bdellovibrionota bacterium]